MCIRDRSDLAGPFVVEGSGHFVQWEAAPVLHSTLQAFFRDLLPA